MKIALDSRFFKALSFFDLPSLFSSFLGRELLPFFHRELSPRHPSDPSVLDVFSQQCTYGVFGPGNFDVSSYKVDFTCATTSVFDKLVTSVNRVGYRSFGSRFSIKLAGIAFEAVITSNIYICRADLENCKLELKRSEKFLRRSNSNNGYHKSSYLYFIDQLRLNSFSCI